MADTIRHTQYLWGADSIDKHLNITRRQLYHMVKRGQLKGISRVGSQYLATPETLAINLQGDKPDDKGPKEKPE